MANNLGDNIQGNASFQLINNESIAQVVDIGIFNFGDLKIAVDAVSNISYQKRPTVFGNKLAFSASHH